MYTKVEKNCVPIDHSWDEPFSETAEVSINTSWDEPSSSVAAKVPIDHSWDESPDEILNEGMVEVTTVKLLWDKPSSSVVAKVPIDHSWDEPCKTSYNPQEYIENNLILRKTPSKLSKTQKKNFRAKERQRFLDLDRKILQNNK